MLHGAACMQVPVLPKHRECICLASTFGAIRVNPNHHRQREIFEAYKLPTGRGSCPNVESKELKGLFAFINTCLSSGSVKSSLTEPEPERFFKHAVLRPLLKKPHHSAGKF